MSDSRPARSGAARARWTLAAIACALAPPGCYPAKETLVNGSPSATSGPVQDAAVAEASLIGSDAAPSCPPIDAAKLASFDLETTHLAVVPPQVVDPEHVLGSFYDRLAELARGTAAEPVRIGVYGDSNMTADYITGAMRRALASRFGDAGHGYVALGRPWPWYLHQDVRHDVDLKTWKMFATSTNRTADGYYGFANIAAESSTPGATTWVETAADTSPIGRTCSGFDVFYLKRPAGGTFTIKVDGRVERVVDTAAPDFEAGFEEIAVPDAPHKLECVAKGNGKVRLFGVALERDPAPGQKGALVDSLGVGALNFEQMQHVETKTRVSMLSHRKYDLVVFLLGTNMFAPGLHATWVKNVLVDFRKALPLTPILILSPPDIVLSGEDAHSDPRIVNLEKQMREIAAHEGAAFWDFRAAMGGDASIKTFVRRGLASPDYIHLLPAGGALMGRRLIYALFQDLQGHLQESPDAGCRAAAATAH
jgi:hypothetical protein